MKKGLMTSILGVSMFVLMGVLLSMRVSATDSVEKVYALAQEDCKKISEWLGEKITGGSQTIDDDLGVFGSGCEFANDYRKGYWGGYASKLFDDIRIAIIEINFRRYDTPREAQDDVRSMMESDSKNKANRTDILFTVRETPDGYEGVLKDPLDVVVRGFQTTYSGTVKVARGSCLISVTGRSFVENDNGEYRYHEYDTKKEKLIDKHPEFNHDREAEMLILARKKAEEVFSVLDCGNDISLPLITSPAVVTEVPLVDNQAPQNPYADCAWNCADQVETKYQCSITLPLDTCSENKLTYQQTCQNACWDRWSSPPEPEISRRGPPRIQKIEKNGKTALLVVGNDLSEPSDSAMEQMKERLAEWNPDTAQFNIPTKVSNIPLGLGVLFLDGNDIDIKRPGSKAWEPLRKGTSIPEGSQIFTGIDSNVWIYGRFGVANIAHGSYITIKRDSANQGNDPNIRFDIKFGEVEIRYEKANYQGIIQTRTPSATATVKGTKFITSYNQEQRYSAVGVYEGQVEVQSLITGEKVMLSSDTGSDLVFIPLQKSQEKNEKTPIVTKQESQGQKSNINSFIPAVVILGLIMTLFILHKKGKLKALYEKYKIKISEIIRKISKTGKEKE